MPTYDYECSACGHKFELFQSYAEAVKKKCPQCKKARLKRLFGTGAAIMFKGSGFYQTDYRSDSYKKAASADKGSSSGGEGKSGESKSAESKSGESKSGSDVKSPTNGANAPAKSSKDSAAKKE